MRSRKMTKVVRESVWELPEEAKHDEGWRAEEWGPWAEEHVYNLGLSFDRLVEEVISDGPVNHVWVDGGFGDVA